MGEDYWHIDSIDKWRVVDCLSPVVNASHYYFMINAIIYRIIKIIPFEYPCDKTGHSKLLVF